MLKWIKTVCLAVIFSHNVAMANDRPHEQVVSPQELQKKAFIEATVGRFMMVNRIPGVALLVYDHGAPQTYYFGYADRERRIPVTARTIFEIGSITKIFTSLLVARQIQAGRMHLEDHISYYLPDFSTAFKQKLRGLTLKSLETHTSGLPFDVPARVNTKTRLQQFFNRCKLGSAVGQTWRYSNIDIGLLGFALEALTQQNYDTLYKQQILMPLGMQPIGTNVPPTLANFVARGYDMSGKPRSRPVDMRLFPAAGAMKASGPDMLLFLKAALRLPGTPKDIAEAMLMTQTTYASMGNMQHGLGWVIYPLALNSPQALVQPYVSTKHSLPAVLLSEEEQHFNGDSMIDKTGTTGGFRAYIAFIPNQHSGIVLLANRRVRNPALLSTGRQILFGLG